MVGYYETIDESVGRMNLLDGSVGRMNLLDGFVLSRVHIWQPHFVRY